MHSRWLLVVWTVLACRPEGPGPDIVAENFLVHLSRSEGKEAQRLLCPKDQSMLAALATRLGVDPIENLNRLRPREGASFQVLPKSQSSESAQVEIIATGGMRFPLSLSRQGSSWCLHLPQLSP